MCDVPATEHRLDHSSSGLDVRPYRSAAGNPIPVAVNAHGHPAPSIVVLTDMFGFSDFYASLAAHLAQEGFNVLIPDLFFRSAPLAELTFPAALRRCAEVDYEQLLADLTSVIDQARRSGPAQSPVGIMGFCLGGTLSLRLSTGLTTATVSFYGFPAGEDISRSTQSPIDAASSLVGPLLGFWGEHDDYVDRRHVAELDRELTELAVEHTFELVPGVGHNFLLPLFDTDPEPSAAVRRAWSTTVTFLRSRLPFSGSQVGVRE